MAESIWAFTGGTKTSLGAVGVAEAGGSVGGFDWGGAVFAVVPAGGWIRSRSPRWRVSLRREFHFRRFSIEIPRSREILAKLSPFLIFTHSGFVEEGFEEEGAFDAGVEEGEERVLAEGS